MNIDEIKKTLINYEELEKRAEKVLIAGEIRFEDVCSVVLEDGEIGINYCVYCRVARFYEYEQVPIEMFADGTDLKEEWQKIKEARRKKRKREEAAARRAEAREMKMMELAELKRLKAKYPEA